MAKYRKVGSQSGMTASEAARRILRENGIFDVTVKQIGQGASDYYNPSTKELCLLAPNYNSTSIASIGIAAHECGHAVQDQEQYGPLVLRSTLVPAANIGSRLSWPIFIAGLAFSLRPLLMGGIVLFLLAVLFQLITLPVEFNASSRALKILGQNHIIPESELRGGRKVLKAAAMTYVAALASSLLQLLRLIILARGRNRD